MGSEIKLYHGDCLKMMEYIPDRSVDMVLCDLPYGTTHCMWDVAIPLEKLWESYGRILKDKGNIVLFGTGIFAFKLALSNEKLFRYDMVWKKSKCGSPFTAKYMPMKKHEMILVFGNSASYYTPQMKEGKPYVRKFTENKMNNMQYGIKGAQADNKGTRHPDTVLDFPQRWRRQDQMHPAQKPVELLEFLIKSYCPENGVVLDNCMGSGSTGVACSKTNRNFIGIELDDKYFICAKQRIEAERQKTLNNIRV